MNAAPSHLLRSLLAVVSLLTAAVTTAQVPLSDKPVFASVSVPGNLALALSVEFPTAISVAHSGRTYSSGNVYLGYFDPDKCYDYQYNKDDLPENWYFYPVAKATDRVCTGRWSGNYLNWASMQTIDPFRWALTGGYRVIDEPGLTVLEKAWASSQGSAANNFPNSSVSGATTVAGATPFTAAGISTGIWSFGNKMRFITGATSTPAHNYAGTPTHYKAAPHQHGTLYEVFIRVKVCDPAIPNLGLGGLESNCTLYGANSYKPTGLMQQYSDKIRYSAFGYLNNPVQNDANMKRDGAVLRARQKFIGPTMPVPGGLPVTNDRAEWDASTGVMKGNPHEKDDAFAFGAAVANSGVMNYLNKFGSTSTQKSYKVYDPVGELYYAVHRYLRNKGNVSTWTSTNGASPETLANWADGFPVITDWKDPVQYACQKNFILGIGDVNTHGDRNLPGTTGGSEPAKPSEVTNDTDLNVATWTDRVGVLQGLSGSLTGTAYGATNSGALMAGLAYWANISDVRPDLPDKQTIQTYWLDVWEGGFNGNKNQFLLATKFGGFKVPDNYDDATATAAQFAAGAATQSWWASTADKLPNNTPRPDTYYTASNPKVMVDNLAKAFSSIASQLSAYSTSFATTEAQVSSLGVSSYASKYDAKSWTGDVVAGVSTINASTGAPSTDTRWSFADKLAAQAGGTGWNANRNIVTYDPAARRGVPFRSTGASAGSKISSDQLALLNTGYTPSGDAENYLNYLRGDRTHERSSTASGSTKAYRDRASLVGDIVNAKALPVGPPSAPYSAVSNPGYDTFKTTYAGRPPMVFAGSNSGMLHAINGTLTGSDAGREVFAYVPGVLFNGPTGTPKVNGLASVGNPDFNHRFMVDAPPVAVDIDLGRAGGATGTTNWKTLLIGGLGKGGKAIYALDITDPTCHKTSTPGCPLTEPNAAARVLWEFTDNDLGYTYGQPVVVKTRKYGWVVVAASGYNNTNGRGYFFFIDPRNGNLLEKVEVGCSSCSASNQLGLAHVNAFIIDLSDGVADAIYGGDLQGNLWRLDVTTESSGYPAPLKFATLTASNGTALPITSKPLPLVQPGTNRRYITVGTGRLLDSTDLNSSQPQRFFAILDGTNAFFSKAAELPAGVSFPLSVGNMRQLTDLTAKVVLDLSTEVGWYIDLGVTAGGPGWRVLLDPISYYGIVSFVATAPNSGDACSPNGSSRTYAIDVGSGSTAFNDRSPYLTSTGVGTDVRIFSASDTDRGCVENCRVVICDEKGNCQSSRFTPHGTLGLQRLNWREIIIRN